MVPHWGARAHQPHGACWPPPTGDAGVGGMTPSGLNRLSIMAEALLFFSSVRYPTHTLPSTVVDTTWVPPRYPRGGGGGAEGLSSTAGLGRPLGMCTLSMALSTGTRHQF